MDMPTWVAIGGLVATSWISVSPLVAASIHFYVKTKSAIKGFTIHLDYFNKKFNEITIDMKDLQSKQQDIALEMGPVKKNGSIVTTDQLDRTIKSIDNRIGSLENTISGELKIIAKIVENKGRESDIDHKFSEKLIEEIVKRIKENGLQVGG